MKSQHTPLGVQKSFESPRERRRPSCYLPHRQAPGSPGGPVWLAVRSTGGQRDLPAEIRRTLHDLSPNLAVLSIERTEDVLCRTRRQERVLAIVSGSFAAVRPCSHTSGSMASWPSRRLGARGSLGSGSRSAQHEAASSCWLEGEPDAGAGRRRHRSTGGHGRDVPSQESPLRRCSH
jgi:hypothetical protein